MCPWERMGCTSMKGEYAGKVVCKLSRVLSFMQSSSGPIQQEPLLLVPYLPCIASSAAEQSNVFAGDKTRACVLTWDVAWHNGTKLEFLYPSLP